MSQEMVATCLTSWWPGLGGGLLRHGRRDGDPDTLRRPRLRRALPASGSPNTSAAPPLLWAGVALDRDQVGWAREQCESTAPPTRLLDSPRAVEPTTQKPTDRNDPVTSTDYLTVSLPPCAPAPNWR